MQFVVVVPEQASTTEPACATISREICGVGLLERTLATAQRAGATDILLVWPRSRWVADAAPIVKSAALRKNGGIRLVSSENFDPNVSSSWIELQDYLESRFVWLPWNWVTNARILANLPTVETSSTDWGMPKWVSQSALDSEMRPQLQPRSLPEGVSVISDATAAAAERFLAARSGKASDGIHTSFNRRLCRPLVKWLSHTDVTPNAVTFAGVIIAIFSAIAFARGNYWSYVAGALLFYVSGLFDEMDGMLARIKFSDSPLGTYIESFADSLSYVLLFAGITIGLYRQYGVWALWMGATLLVGTVLALVVTTMQRKRAAAADRPTEYLGNFYRKLEQDSSSWMSRWVRQAQGFQRRGIMIHYVVIFTVVGALPLLFFLATVGAHLTWILASYYNHKFFKQAPSVSVTEIRASQEAL